MNYCATELPKMSNAVVVTSSYYNNHHHPQQHHYSFNNSSINNSSNSNNNNNSTPSSSTSINNTMTDDLPKQFVSSLRILFDILDENHSGFVRLSDIESRWKEDGVKGLPSGVVDALKKVTPANGYLNFDRFVSGLKLVLWRTKHNMVGSGSSSSDAGISAFPLFQFPEQQSDEFQQSKENKFVYHIDDDDDDDDDDIKPNNGHHLVSTQPQFNNLSDHINPTNPHQQFTTSMKQSTNSADVFNASFTIPSGTNHPYGSLNRPNYPQNNLGYQNNISYSTCSNSSTSTVTDSGHHFRNSSNNIINTHDVSRSFNDTIHPSSGSSSVPGDKMTPQIQQQQQRLPYVTRCPERPPLQPRQPVVIHPHSHPYSNNNNTHLQDMPVPDVSGESVAPPPPPLPPPIIHPQPFSPPQVPPRDQNKVNILNELKNWQRQQRMKNLTTTTDSLNVRRGSEWGSGINRNPLMTDNILTKDTDRNTYVNIDNFQQRRNQEEYATKKSADLRHSTRRWDGRRHTLTSGVDHSMIKRMRQLEEEKEMLEQGMEVLESARVWYQKQLASIQDKQKVAAWSSFNDSSLEASQERMNFQRTRISEVNQQLKTLIESSERGFPLHMNLAIGSAGHPLILEDNCAKMLKEQNRQLTEEISSKCDKITQLEQEKTALIRELFESRSRSKSSLDDTTFM